MNINVISCGENVKGQVDVMFWGGNVLVLVNLKLINGFTQMRRHMSVRFVRKHSQELGI